MKYLRKFATEAEVFMTKTPNAVLAEDTKKVLYNVNNSGVYIQHIDGKLYKKADWTANGFASSEANGVAVIAEKCMFVVAKEARGATSWSDTAGLVEGLPELSEEEAKGDYAGENNTHLILGAYESSAAKLCNDYIFPNGTRGYLPALGELIVAANNRTSIDAALEVIGGAKVSSSTYWSSTQVSANQAYMYNFYKRSISAFNKTSEGYYYKAFGPLNL